MSVLLLAVVFGSPLQAATQEAPKEAPKQKISDAPEVPAAIIGKAPPLKGEAIAYFPDKPKTSG
ncbi:MAG: hypothetical protein VW840_20220, partial [Gammaproteobacteria bacterium]